MDLNSCLVNLCNSFITYKNVYDKNMSGFIECEQYKGDYYPRLYHLAKWGYLDMVKYYMRILPVSLHTGMAGAAEGGHLDIMKFFCGEGVSFSEGLNSAVEAGHLHIVKFIVERYSDNLDWAMHIAVRIGHLNIVKYFIEIRPDKSEWLMQSAIKYDQKEVIEFLRNFKLKK